MRTAERQAPPAPAGDDLQGALLRNVRRVRAMLGDYRCTECGYVVTVLRELDWCPMCGVAAWATCVDGTEAITVAPGAPER